jgi:hypothetical protein
MSDQLSAEILASLIKGFPRTTKTTTTTTTTTTKQNVDPAVHFVYSRVKIDSNPRLELEFEPKCIYCCGFKIASNPKGP